MDNKNLYPTIILLLLGTLVFILVREFLAGIITALVISLFLLPAFRFLQKKIPGRLASLLLIFIVITAVSTLIFFITQELLYQARQYTDQESIRSVITTFLEYVPFEAAKLNEIIDSLSVQIRNVLLGLAYSTVSSIPNITINVLITFFITYYLLINWKQATDFAKKVIPVSRKKVFDNIKESFYGILYGLGLIALIEFIVASVGLYIAGVELYLFFALIIAIAAFIPFFGPITVWLPIFLYYVFISNWFSAFVVLITGLVITLGIDSYLIHIIVGKKSCINPVFMMLGVLGGVALFGIVGFIVGPLIIIFFIEYLREYTQMIGKETG